ncbi:MAG: YeeE/YedE thiosulfate transporter family protein [Acidobacteriota bacterium]|nr:YeeE/YedE family protein [Blastocatellia bacterium]MDW8239906.1 YeeE/YedE thiosulfate transporter family protein [Acidobacteriota bacterium]
MTTTLLLGFLTGIGFGFALHRAGFSRCNLVHRGLWLRDFTMLKVMLTAIVVSLIGIAALSALSPELVHWKIKPLYLWGVIAGGFIFGVGIALGGYCPGTAVVGLGSGIGEAILAVVGGLMGALAFIVVYPWLKPILIEPANLGKITIPSVLGLPVLPVALAFALMLVGVIWWLTRLERRMRERAKAPVQN